MGVTAELRVVPIREGTMATHSLTGLRRPLRKFFGVRCGRIKVVPSSLGSVWGSLPNYESKPIREGTLATHSLTGLRRPLAIFLRSGAVVFWGFWVRCVSVKFVSSSLGSILGSLPNYGCPMSNLSMSNVNLYSAFS